MDTRGYLIVVEFNLPRTATKRGGGPDWRILLAVFSPAMSVMRELALCPAYDQFSLAQRSASSRRSSPQNTS